MTAIPQPGPLAPQDVTALILAGGQGRRLGGVDKGLVRLHARPLIEYVLRALRPQAASVLISANQNQEQYRKYGQVVQDPAGFDGSQGPLAGLLAAASHIKTPWLVVAGCDMPALPDDYVAQLYAGLMAQGGRLPLRTPRPRPFHLSAATCKHAGHSAGLPARWSPRCASLVGITARGAGGV
ncbi:molybdopterin-guanine dinucleotide biosynthesis protein [Advenella kashmirensis WT001]|uniref:Molybdopterin-guanine dinucleotide biosynthesis protein n=1 Tax=Advenella kashmirensis (strain DSM 17095 / LMG 22695 / WT001) TaxID=1036672 RepID=I3U9W6_ADVKW|nr:NTP transferase domain-containing protein [Advenella kashmirensis]AFK61804.1 molybdopterin-guanine dinucleotide biosynthesis protein [Advenella kashmirensis WT001]